MYKLLTIIFLIVCLETRTDPEIAIGWGMVAGVFAMADSVQHLGEWDMNVYELYIKTTYNEIKLLIDNIQDPIVKEILEQPWVEEYTINLVKNKPKKGYKKLIKK